MNRALISLITSAAICITAVPFTAMAEDDTTIETCTVNFLDYDGNTFFKMAVPSGYHFTDEMINQLDTSSLNMQIDTRTQKRFLSWWGIPEYIYTDTDIKPLSATAAISLEKLPEKTNYYALETNISTAGLDVNIKIETQTGIDEDGKYITEKEVVDISSTCSLNYATAAEAFKSGDKASIEIYPIHSSQPIGSYEITYTGGIADVDKDDMITASDATTVLAEYTKLSSDSDYKVAESVSKYGDMDFDGIINGSDASTLLRYYTIKSSAPEYTLDMFYDENSELIQK